MSLEGYPQAKDLSALSTGKNAPVHYTPSAATQPSAAESRRMETQSSVASARSLAALEPEPSLMFKLGGAVSGIANTTGKILGGTAGLALNAVTGGGAGQIASGISDIASGNIKSGMSSISQGLAGVAGVPSDPASVGRAANLPANAEVLSKEINQTSINASNADDWRVKISAPFSLLEGKNIPFLARLKYTNGVVFPYLPSITYSSKANYNTQSVVHNNYPFHSYQNSVVDDITITGQFSCETPSDAEYWLAVTHFFRGATKMFFGASNNAGNPPIICKLNGYGTHVFNDIPVIIKSFDITLPPDVDYIMWEKGSEKTWVPILSEVIVTVAPVYSREKIRDFNLQDFASGNVTNTKGFA